MRYSKAVVTLILILIIAFSVSILYIFVKTGSEPTTLVAGFFSFVSVELWALAPGRGLSPRAK
ncbi:MAG: hypothetical protein LBV08_04460 [Clostridiales bacterium]|nr:hypothetical protein [Clostridiales bacterium]